MNLKSVVSHSAVLALLASSASSYAAPKETPNKAILGDATYLTMKLNKLSHPTVIWIDPELAVSSKVVNASDDQLTKEKKVSDTIGFASKVDGEDADVYTQTQVDADIDANGGLGLNGNFGSGRAAIVGPWQLKGSGKTMMVNPRSDQYHRSGASVMGEGVWEAAWSKLLYKELPYGAYRVLGVVATGSNATLHGSYFEPRVVIGREDPLRPAHFVLNPTGEEEKPEFENRRIKEAMKNIVQALPKPEGYKSRGRQADFRAGVFEFIHRQAVQHGYAWAHSLFHGGTSPSNTGLDGRMLDFGSYAAFDGYPQARVMDEDGFFGDTELYKRDLLKDIRDSWIRTLPKDLLEVLPSQSEMDAQFEKSFQTARQTEMLRLAGAFTELASQLRSTAEGRELAEVLLKIAEAGNENKIEVWQGQSPFGTGTYKLGQILKTLAAEPLQTLSSHDSKLSAVLSDGDLRSKLVSAYKKTFTLQQELAAQHGIGSRGEALYRMAAVKVRNAKMNSMYRIRANHEKVAEAIAKFKETGDAKQVSDLINSMVDDSRREFWDAEPFTIVMRERAGKDGEKIRRVLDARTGRMTDEIQKSALQNELEQRRDAIDTMYSPKPVAVVHKPVRALRCSDMFAAAGIL